MSTLVAIAYPNPASAHRALSAVEEMRQQHFLQITDAIVASNENGQIKLDQMHNLAKSGAARGTVWGGLAGLIFLQPIAGMAIGAAAGALSGRQKDIGIDDEFAKALTAKVEPGHAVLLLLAPSDAPGHPERVAAVFHKLNIGGDLLYTNLSADDEQYLRDLADEHQ